jgi:hypothetical protein
MKDFLDAVRDGKKETAASFDYGARLTEFTLLGTCATRRRWKQARMERRENEGDQPLDLNHWLGRRGRKGLPV